MKAIIIVDLPNNLDMPLDDIRTQITLSSKDITKSLLYLKYDKVKLKPMPSKYELTIEKGNRYAVGLNDCIDEVLGETECQRKN